MIIGVGIISSLQVNIYGLSIMFSILCCMKYLKTRWINLVPVVHVYEIFLWRSESGPWGHLKYRLSYCKSNMENNFWAPVVDCHYYPIVLMEGIIEKLLKKNCCW